MYTELIMGSIGSLWLLRHEAIAEVCRSWCKAGAAARGTALHGLLRPSTVIHGVFL